jgi:signal peptidase II
VSALPDLPAPYGRPPGRPPSGTGRFARLAPVFVLLLLCVGCDQAVKSVARRTLAGAAPVSLLDGVIRLEYAENPGAFLSLGAGLPAAARFAAFGLLAALAAAAACLLVLRGREWPASRRLAFALVLAGGIGNLIDRFFNGGVVVDFVSVGFGPLRTGIFNVADLAITGGAVWLMIQAAAWQSQDLNG